jgi:lysozyme
MTPADFATLRAAVQADEGTGPSRDGRFFPYQDTVGKTTIGWGRNLTDVGISRGEAIQLLDNDLTQAVTALTAAHPIVATLSPVRQIVLGNMAFNVGVPGLGKFAKMWAAIHSGDFTAAATEMLDSTWATQVGARATRLASEMASGDLT